MKKTINIFLLAITLSAFQACETKTEDNNETSETSSSNKLAEARALSNKNRMELAEKRRVANEKLVATTPFYTHSSGIVVYNKAEVDPTFVGGNKAMEEYLRDNLVYPAEAQKKELEGTVFVDFMIATNGQVSDVNVINTTFSESVDELFNTEAIRVVSEMPNWIAGTQHGDAVNVAYSIPITFLLQ